MLYELNITDELRERLNNQDEICYEYQNRIPFVTYDKYMNYYYKENSITSEFIRLLFEQHPQFESKKGDIIISTSKTCIIDEYGGNGECNWHIDNIGFPSTQRMNLIISWNGQGTSCIPVHQSDVIRSMGDKFINENRTDYENFPTVYNYPNTPIQSYYSPDSNRMILLAMAGKRVLHRRNPILESDIGLYRYVLNIYYN